MLDRTQRPGDVIRDTLRQIDEVLAPARETMSRTLDALGIEYGPPNTALKREQDPPQLKFPPTFPKRQTTISKHKRIIAVCRKLEQIYLEEYEELDRDKPKPTYQDYRDAILHDLGEKMNERRLRSILHWAEEGWYDLV